MRICLSPSFLADLDDMTDQAARHRPADASVALDHLRAVCREALALHPTLGRRRPELGRRRRSLPVGDRTLLYSHDPDAEELRLDRLLGHEETALR
ncbi:type II toxin-antitoxin system RelE/ParE family toxin [Albimonas sp. CAU 1670]|uniref:type II toxin-antitoxin system RelE/ParE family toxin n=1 Tax=Albimonas sp. CAU 1670 TaxID=3032599 RepID=UPI0023D9EB94|nr:type II toxin-antitoxin system RelE/ParE family toxin [Albimonas sp. CAU 1670]MDF2231670.1 type II toxin-antitoxin system RelE/ParE family toxin [Albimonas sp. CAU 1670]